MAVWRVSTFDESPILFTAMSLSMQQFRCCRWGQPSPSPALVHPHLPSPPAGVASLDPAWAPCTLRRRGDRVRQSTTPLSGRQDRRRPGQPPAGAAPPRFQKSERRGRHPCRSKSTGACWTVHLDLADMLSAVKLGHHGSVRRHQAASVHSRSHTKEGCAGNRIGRDEHHHGDRFDDEPRRDYPLRPVLVDAESALLASQAGTVRSQRTMREPTA